MAYKSSLFSDSLFGAGSGADGDVYASVLASAQRRLLQLTRKMLAEYPRLRRWEQTDDVYQDAMLRLHRALGEVRPQSYREFFGLAALQIRRTLIDLARHHFGPQGAAARYRSDPLLQKDIRQRHPADDSTEPLTLAEWTAFHEAVEDLPDDERETFAAVFYGGMTYAEAAQTLDASRRSVIRRMNRARIRLARYVTVDLSETAGQR